jgi:hypothetical protein
MKLSGTQKPIACSVSTIFPNFHLIARDVDKNRTKYLQKNQIYCIKKPLKPSLLNKLIKKIKYADTDYIMSTNSKGGVTSEST